MSRFRVFIEGVGKWVNFVDREVELSQLFDFAERGHPFPIAVYGPEGCGKTTLLKCFLEELRDRDYVAIYVDALELQDLNRAMLCTHREVWEIVQSLAGAVPVGENIAKTITLLLRKLHEKLSLRGKRLVVILDDVYRAVGIENAVRYTKLLYEWISNLHTEFNVKHVLFVLTTSEGLSKRELYRHTYVHVYMMWNLPKEGFYELVRQLDVPVDPDVLWRLTGGNPRVLIDIATHSWDIDRWLRYVIHRVSSLVRDLDQDRLRRLAEDPDSDWELAKVLEERGLMIELNRAHVLGIEPKPDPELGIGKEWAWQIPAYRNAIAKPNHLKT